MKNILIIFLSTLFLTTFFSCKKEIIDVDVPSKTFEPAEFYDQYLIKEIDIREENVSSHYLYYLINYDDYFLVWQSLIIDSLPLENKYTLYNLNGSKLWTKSSTEVSGIKWEEENIKIVDGKIYTLYRDELDCFDLLTGNLLWEMPLSSNCITKWFQNDEQYQNSLTAYQTCNTSNGSNINI